MSNLVILETISLLFNHKLEYPPSKMPVCEVVKQPFKIRHAMEFLKIGCLSEPSFCVLELK